MDSFISEAAPEPEKNKQKQAFKRIWDLPVDQQLRWLMADKALREAWNGTDLLGPARAGARSASSAALSGSAAPALTSASGPSDSCQVVRHGARPSTVEPTVSPRSLEQAGASASGNATVEDAAAAALAQIASHVPSSRGSGAAPDPAKRGSATTLSREQRGWVRHQIHRLDRSYETLYNDFHAKHGPLVSLTCFKARIETHHWWLRPDLGRKDCVCQKEISLNELLECGRLMWTQWEETTGGLLHRRADALGRASSHALPYVHR